MLGRERETFTFVARKTVDEVSGERKHKTATGYSYKIKHLPLFKSDCVFVLKSPQDDYYRYYLQIFTSPF